MKGGRRVLGSHQYQGSIATKGDNGRMPIVRDFRTIPQFNVDAVAASGRYVGKVSYWKLYATENLYRILIHSILSLQLPDWWAQAANPRIQSGAIRRREDYLANPWHTTPGRHSVYYIDLTELNEIARANAQYIRPVIIDIDNFIARIEMIRLPRNAVAHMSFLNPADRKRVDTIYEDFKNLINMVQQKIALQVPQ